MTQSDPHDLGRIKIFGLKDTTTGAHVGAVGKYKKDGPLIRLDGTHVLCLHRNDYVTIKLPPQANAARHCAADEFALPDGATIASIDFYASKGHEERREPFASASAAGTTVTVSTGEVVGVTKHNLALFDVTIAPDRRSATLKDAEDPTKYDHMNQHPEKFGEHVWYLVIVNVPGEGMLDMDPELNNTGGGNASAHGLVNIDDFPGLGEATLIGDGSGVSTG